LRYWVDVVRTVSGGMDNTFFDVPRVSTITAKQRRSR